MTFLNPFFFLALVASSLPVLIHLFNLRQLKTVEFSSVRFLKELEKTRIRSLKIKQIILLILRTLAITFMVFAFARPVLKGYLSGFGTHARSSVIIVIDDTYSMDVVDENGRYIDQAKALASRIAEILEDGDEFALIRVSEAPEVSTGGLTHNLALLKRLIKETEISFRHGKLSTAVKKAGELLKNSVNLNREIYVITDLQRTAIDDEVNFKLDPDIKIFILSIGREEPQNLFISSVNIKNKLLFSGRPVQVEVVVSNSGDLKVTNYVASVYILGKRVARKSFNIEPNSSTMLDFNILTEKNLSGFIDGFVEIEGDNFNYDNRRYFTFFIPGKLNILLAGEPEDAKYLKLALLAQENLFKHILKIFSNMMSFYL
jgi:hypothetical protein